MKRLFVIATLIAGVVWLSHHRAARHASEARAALWNDAPLPPRPVETPARPVKHRRERFAQVLPSGGHVVVTVSETNQPNCCDETAEQCETPVASQVTQPGAPVVKSDLMFTSDRALDNLRTQIDKRVASWLAESGVPDEWKAPASLLRSLPLGEPTVRDVEKDYATLYEASVPLDLSRSRKATFIQEYHRHVAGQRLALAGGGLGFVLACLGILVGYVRTDEATKGYYTNRLRLLAAGGVGAAGVVLYQWMTRV